MYKIDKKQISLLGNTQRCRAFWIITCNVHVNGKAGYRVAVPVNLFVYG